MTTKILAFAGSSRTGSLNQMLLDVAAAGARAAGAIVTTVRLADFAMPLYDAELEAKDGLPSHAEKLQALFASHQGLLIATPEHNGGYTALLKNALDWVSRSRPDGSMGTSLYVGKFAAIVSASPGTLGGVRSQIALKMVLDKLGVIVIPQSFALGLADRAFDAAGALRDKKVEELVAAVGASLVEVFAAQTASSRAKG